MHGCGGGGCAGGDLVRIVLLGLGLQGRAVLYDLSRAPGMDELVAADAAVDVSALGNLLAPDAPVRFEKVDASDPADLARLFAPAPDVVIDMLPRQFHRTVAEVAIAAGAHYVNASYTGEVAELDDRAREAGVVLMPEAGLDPGIDLVLAGEAVGRFEAVDEFISYGAGVPDGPAANNPLKYKITWTFEGVLASYFRPARLVEGGQVVDIPPEDQFANRFVHAVAVPGVGVLEAFPNGDAVRYVERLGLAGQVRTAGRYAMRWPGHCQFWKALVDLGFLDERPLDGLRPQLAPREFLRALLEPQLQYAPDERDVAIVRVQVAGVRDGRRERLVFEMIDRRDLATGLFAMNRTVGFTASIVAQMIARGEIAGSGLLSPLTDVPFAAFIDELRQRGIQVTERSEPAS